MPRADSLKTPCHILILFVNKKYSSYFTNIVVFKNTEITAADPH